MRVHTFYICSLFEINVYITLIWILSVAAILYPNLKVAHQISDLSCLLKSAVPTLGFVRFSRMHSTGNAESSFVLLLPSSPITAVLITRSPGVARSVPMLCLCFFSGNLLIGRTNVHTHAHT